MLSKEELTEVIQQEIQNCIAVFYAFGEVTEQNIQQLAQTLQTTDQEVTKLLHHSQTIIQENIRNIVRKTFDEELTNIENRIEKINEDISNYQQDVLQTQQKINKKFTFYLFSLFSLTLFSFILLIILYFL